MTKTIRFESLLRRPPSGTVVDLAGTSIHFQPDATGLEFADVPADLAPILDAIPEGYRRADGEEAAPAPAAPTPPAAPPSPDDPGTQPVHGDAGVVTGDDLIELEAMADDQLRDVFEREVGRKPSPKAGRDTMIDQIETARAAKAGA